MGRTGSVHAVSVQLAIDQRHEAEEVLVQRQESADGEDRQEAGSCNLLRAVEQNRIQADHDAKKLRMSERMSERPPQPTRDFTNSSSCSAEGASEAPTHWPRTSN